MQMSDIHAIFRCIVHVWYVTSSEFMFSSLFAGSSVLEAIFQLKITDYSPFDFRMLLTSMAFFLTSKDLVLIPRVA